MKKLAFPLVLVALLAGCGGGGGGGGSSSIPAPGPSSTSNPGPGSTPTATPTTTPTAKPTATPTSQPTPGIASMTVTTNGSIVSGTPTSVPITVTAYTASHVAITGTYPTAITLANNDPSGGTILSPTTVTSSTQAVMLSYNGSSQYRGTTITASAAGVSNAQLALSGPGCDTSNDSLSQVLDDYEPCDLWAAYNLPALTAGNGQTIAIIDAYDDPNAESDLAVYRKEFGLPACTSANGCFKKVNQTGSASPLPSVNWAWAGEISTDLDAVSAVCPNCKILLVESNDSYSNNLDAAVDAAVSLGANVVTMSYGSPEYSGETAEDIHFNHPGVVFVAAAGDSGYGTQYPAASPYVTAVGGTRLVTASNARGWTETVWPGTGSGCSLYEPKPSWQTDSGCSKRTMNDVAADGDQTTGIAFYFTNPTIPLPPSKLPWGIVGGTSISAPIVAGMYALAGNESSVVATSYPYLHPQNLYPVLSGANGTCSPSYLCTAGSGYNAPAGLGTPNGLGGSLQSLVQPMYAARRTIRMAPATTQFHRACAYDPRPRYTSCFALIGNTQGIR